MSFFFFFYFLNLYNSFILKNYVNNRINKIYMGCDYYIDKNLYIYDKSDTVLSYINLEKQKCYFWEYDDDDDDDSDDKNNNNNQMQKNISFNLN